MHHNAEWLEFFRCRCFDIQIHTYLVQLFETLAKFTSVSCGMLNRRVMIKSPADALLKHRFVFRQVSCVAAQGDNVLLSGRELDGLCTTFQFSFPQGLLLIFGQPPGAVLQRFFFCVNRIDKSWFTVPTQRFSRCDFAEQFQVLLSNRDFQDTHLLILSTILPACGLH